MKNELAVSGSGALDSDRNAVNNSSPADIKSTISGLLPCSDVILFNGGITCGVYMDWKRKVSPLFDSSVRNETVIVLMCTLGGSPDDAFRMMRSLQQHYKIVKVLLFGACYSAGTLFALGADEIYMTYDANLGPLDVQIQKEDDIYRMSGECYRQALTDLAEIAGSVFFRNFMTLRMNSNLPLSTNTASKISSEITTKLLSPITAQIEPQKLGEMMRSQSVGISYALRLMKGRYNPQVADKAVRRLAQHYPSHSTVIDRDEAESMGLCVKSLDPVVDFGGCFNDISHYMFRPINGCDIRVNDLAVKE